MKIWIGGPEISWPFTETNLFQTVSNKKIIGFFAKWINPDKDNHAIRKFVFTFDGNQ